MSDATPEPLQRASDPKHTECHTHDLRDMGVPPSGLQPPGFDPQRERLRDQGAAWALAVLGLFVWAVGQWVAPPVAPAEAWHCPRPRSLRVERGFTRAVTCETPPGGGHPLRGPARWLFGRRIVLDRADASALEALPRIGEARARAILAARAHSPFTSLDDLDRVHGIGAATIEAMRPFARIDPPRFTETAADAPTPSGPAVSAKDGGEG